MEEILSMLRKDHEMFREILVSAEKELSRLNLKPKTSEERFELLREIIVITYKLSEFAGMTSKHRQIEEITVYPELEKLGLREEVRKLRRQHADIVKEINLLANILKEYREYRRPIEEIAENLVKVFAKIKPMYLEHISFEEKCFQNCFSILENI